jgi:glycosyltransferase involved in cell wall biosynthesis
VKIAILNDLHPSEFPGAATIAYGFAEEASKSQIVEYWTSSTDPSKIARGNLFSEEILSTSRVRDARIAHSFIRKILAEFFSTQSSFWYLKNLLRFKPEIVWVHQIGSRFPRTVILINKLFRVRTLVTLHDFSLALPRKLFPIDFGLATSEVDSILDRIETRNSNYKLKLHINEPFRFRITYKIRIELLRCLYLMADHVIAISSLQAKILSLLGFRISGEIANGIDKCKCPEQIRVVKSILFAGRPNAKGLDQVIQAVAKSDWHLHLAGPNRLQEISSQTLLPSQYTYHGAMNRDDLFELLHQVQVVAVLSECFDVYPTITIESLRHGTAVITTITTGNSNLVRSISEDLKIQYASVPPLNVLEGVLQTLYKNSSISICSDSTLSSVQESYNSYLNQYINSN